MHSQHHDVTVKILSNAQHTGAIAMITMAFYVLQPACWSFQCSIFDTFSIFSVIALFARGRGSHLPKWIVVILYSFSCQVSLLMCGNVGIKQQASSLQLPRIFNSSSLDATNTMLLLFSEIWQSQHFSSKSQLYVVQQQ